MFYEKLAEAKQEKKRKRYTPELAALGTVGLGGAALSRLKADPAYMAKRQRVMNIMHSGAGKKSKANQRARQALKRVRRAQTIGVGAGGLILGLAGKSVYDKFKHNRRER